MGETPSYLKASGMLFGVLLNFGSPRLVWKCIAFPRPSIEVHLRPFAVEGKGSANERE
jgi:hypothetical protein